MNIKLTNYKEPEETIWQARVDSEKKERIHQHIQISPVTNAKNLNRQEEIAFLGFACDEGVRRNKGRIGAKNGPKAIRKSLQNLCISSAWNIPLSDFGDITCEGSDLEKSQEELGETVCLLLKNRNLPILLGGGHETAWGHYQGISKALSQKTRLALINIDAHLDLRTPPSEQGGSSGTPFFQIAKSCQEEKKEFIYSCIGFQESANTESLLKTAKELNTLIISAKDLEKESRNTPLQKIKKVLEDCDLFYLSICLDAFAAHIAPAVSAPQVCGIELKTILPILELLFSSKKLISLDVVELAPQYDQNQITAKLAASLIYNLLLAQGNNNHFYNRAQYTQTFLKKSPPA